MPSSAATLSRGARSLLRAAQRGPRRRLTRRGERCDHVDLGARFCRPGLERRDDRRQLGELFAIFVRQRGEELRRGDAEHCLVARNADAPASRERSGAPSWRAATFQYGCSRALADPRLPPLGFFRNERTSSALLSAPSPIVARTAEG